MYSSQRVLRGCRRIPSPTYPKFSPWLSHSSPRASASCRASSSPCCSLELTLSSATSPEHTQSEADAVRPSVDWFEPDYSIKAFLTGRLSNQLNQPHSTPHS